MHVVDEGVGEAQVSWLRREWLLPHHEPRTARKNAIEKGHPLDTMVGPEVGNHQLIESMKFVSKPDLVCLPQDGLDKARGRVEQRHD